MTPATRATALLLAAVAFAAMFALGAVVAYHLAVREPKPGPHHLKVVEHRHRLAPRHEWLSWTVSLVVRWYRWEDGGPKSAVVLASLFLAFTVIGASQ